MYLATLTTYHYTFTALGTTEQEARGILAAGWAEHADRTGALEWDQYEDDVNVEELNVGTCNRDGSHLVTADTSSSGSRQHYIDTGAYLPDSEDEDDDTLDPGAANEPPTPAADLLARFRSDAAEVAAMYAAIENPDVSDDDSPTYDDADAAADVLAETYLYALAAHLSAYVEG